jgi:hypothetical protein
MFHYLDFRFQIFDFNGRIIVLPMDTSTQAIRALKTFEFYVRYVWPVHRLFVKSKIARRCVRCVFSERRAPLDASGVCELCKALEQNQAPRRTVNPEDANALNEILRSAQGKGTGRYDALVLFSGGKDSTYMIRRIRDEFPNSQAAHADDDHSQWIYESHRVGKRERNGWPAGGRACSGPALSALLHQTVSAHADAFECGRRLWNR